MNKLSGNSINNGLFIGRARRLIIPEHQVEHYSISQDDIETEFLRYQTAIEAVDKDISAELQHSTLNSKDAEIMASHRDILHDPEIHNLVKRCTFKLAQARRNQAAGLGSIGQWMDPIPPDYKESRRMDFVLSWSQWTRYGILFYGDTSSVFLDSSLVSLPVR